GRATVGHRRRAQPRRRVLPDVRDRADRAPRRGPCLHPAADRRRRGRTDDEDDEEPFERRGRERTGMSLAWGASLKLGTERIRLSLANCSVSLPRLLPRRDEDRVHRSYLAIYLRASRQWD